MHAELILALFSSLRAAVGRAVPPVQPLPAHPPSAR
jgi:hypothetical protein